MKTINFFINYVVILLLAGNMVFAQAEKKEVVTKVYEISPTGSIHILQSSNIHGNNRFNIEIMTWDRNEVRVVSELTYNGIGKQEDIDKLLNVFKNMQAESSENELNLNLNLIDCLCYSAMRSVFSWLFRRNEINTVLSNGDRLTSVIAESIKTNHTIWIPASLSVNVNSRFGKLKMASITGNVNLILRNHDLEMGNFGESGIFEMRFSEATIGRGSEATFNVHNSVINAIELKNVTIESRFSNISIAKADNVSLASYNSKFNFATVNTFNCRQSRFDTFKFDEIVNNASFTEANNTNVDINRTSASFSGFSGNFRFGTVNLKINPNVIFNLDYDGTHGQFENVSSDRFKTRLVVNQYPSRLNVQGTNADAKCNIKVVANNVTFRIIE